MKAGRGGGNVGGNGVASNVGINDNAAEGKRRSERVKREKPNFYDAMEYDNKMRKVKSLLTHFFMFRLTN